MSTELVTMILFGGLLFLLLAGVQVFYAIGFISTLVIFLTGDIPDLYMIATTTFGQITQEGLITLPLFILMGTFLLHSGLSERMFSSLNIWLNEIPGSLAVVATGVCIALAMTGGFGPGILTMGLVAVPAMLKQGYSKSLTLGSVIGGGVLGSIIPPSLSMIIFGYIARLSIGKLFFAGAIPGFITGLLNIIYIIVLCRLNPKIAPKADIEVTWEKRIKAIKDIIPLALLVLMVLGTIFFGIATPTEAAGIGSLGAIFLCAINKKLTLEVIKNSCIETLKISGMSLGILITASLFGVVYTSAGAQDMVMSIVTGLEVNRWVIIAVMQIILLILGAFMDDFAIITICAPIFMPIVVHLGFDPIWYAIVFILNMQVAYLSPPFGWALILMKSVAPPEIKTRDIWRSVPPFMIIQVIALIMTMIWPQLALWLPSKM
ncbi:MAG: TRAP transporter large permease subunit [Pseudomonadota bacterium]